jgi:hypothetical protein
MTRSLRHQQLERLLFAHRERLEGLLRCCRVHEGVQDLAGQTGGSKGRPALRDPVQPGEELAWPDVLEEVALGA